MRRARAWTTRRFVQFTIEPSDETRVADDAGETNKWFALGVRPGVPWFVMEVVSSCPMQAMGFVWQLSSGIFAQTIVVKATFVLEQGHAKLAPQPQWEATNDQDRFVQTGPHEVVFVSTDRVPFKRRVDVMLVGHAHAPGKLPVRSLVTKLTVGDFSKSIEVVCDRGFRSPEDLLVEGPHFTKMALDWTRAAGGSGTTNPVGMSFDAAANAFGLISMPNLQPIKTTVVRGADRFAPIGYGPIAPNWPERSQYLEDFKDTFSPADWTTRPLPEKFDFDYFQAAPLDQQLPRLRPDELLVLENLHPLHAQLKTRLPGVCPRAIALRASGEREDVTLVADTLWIDPDRNICCVVWRGSIGLRSATEAGIIAVTLQEPTTSELQDEDVIETLPADLVDEEDLASMTLIAPFGARPVGPAMPFVNANHQERSPIPVRSNDDGALPFGPSGLSCAPPPPIARGQITLPAQSPTSSPTINAAREFVSLEPEQASKHVQSPLTPAVFSEASTTAPSGWSGPVPSEATTIRETKPTDTGLSGASFVSPDDVREATPALWQLLWIDAAQQKALAPFAKAPNKNGRSIDDVLKEAVAKDGRFVPPTITVEGNLEFTFDELEALKAAMSAVLPMITPADAKLAMMVAVVKDFLSAPGLSAAPEVCAGLTARVRETFVAEKAGLPADYVEKQVERVMLSGRHYQRRKVFGGMYLRSLLWLPGEKSALVTYLPADIAAEMPMWKQFRARIIAEVHLGQDQYEIANKALKVVGLSRIHSEESRAN